jgi:hypothetical protein
MEKVLNDPENKNHEQVIKAAFGAHPNFDLNVVKENVQHLKNGRVLVDLEADTTIKDSIGFTSYDKAVPKRNPTFVKFSTNYYKRWWFLLSIEILIADYVASISTAETSPPGRVDRQGPERSQS